MYFTKFPYHANFVFAKSFTASSGRLSVGDNVLTGSFETYSDDVVRLSAKGKAWKPNKVLAPLNFPKSGKTARVKIGKDFGITVLDKKGKAVFQSTPGAGFGVSGAASMFKFQVPANSRFYGMGEKNLETLELSGYRVKFWNTDVWSDFHFAQWLNHTTDPSYFSTPYLAVQAGSVWIGLLLNTAWPTFMETPGIDEDRVFVEWQRTSKELILGAEGGEPDLVVLVADSLPELTRKLQKLVGVTPLPPAWALGYHQSRWGYGGKELLDLDRQFAELGIPCDGLWMDLDYMDGFRVFQYNRKIFPGGIRGVADKLAANKRRIVPIIDPGVKKEDGYEVYESGLEADIFCLNAENEPFVGLVWPGETVFPDFTMPKARNWWAGYARSFIEEGFGAAWVDMNDPSCGPVDPQGMRFNFGREPHAQHHNQYALGMQMATIQGFLKAQPRKRPFVLSRSGHTGSSRYSAIWTGDNMSSYYYLRLSIPTVLNMSLSGLPFAGPDVGGFGGDCTEGLMLDWIKAGFLFPFCRNHSVKDSKPQEPWAFSGSATGVIGRFIRARYKLMPYLYNLFMDQEEVGDPILRPLIYEFEDGKTQPIAKIKDQFLVGPSILQAPIVNEKPRSREAFLPGSLPWMEEGTGEWIKPGRIHVAPGRAETPLFWRCGALVPMTIGTPRSNKRNFRNVEMHCFAPKNWTGKSEYLYRADDGETFNYRKGKRSSVKVTMTVSAGALAITTTDVQTGYGAINMRFIVYAKFTKVTVNGKPAKLEPITAGIAAKKAPAYRVVI